MLVKVRAAGLSRSVEVTILEEAVLEREPLLLSLTPLLVIKVDVGALKILRNLYHSQSQIPLMHIKVSGQIQLSKFKYHSLE